MGSVSPEQAVAWQAVPARTTRPVRGRRRASGEMRDLTGTGQMLQDGSRPPVRLQVLVIAGVVVILLFSALVAVLKIGADGYYVLSPGQAPVVTASALCKPSGSDFALPDGRPCVQLVLPPDQTHPTQ